MCEAWKADFKAFLADMGERPSRRHSLDRIDNDGHYEPGNCRWATDVVQANNKGTYNRRITIGGVSLTVAQAAAHYGLSYDKLIDRLQAGWSPEKAIRP